MSKTEDYILDKMRFEFDRGYTLAKKEDILRWKHFKDILKNCQNKEYKEYNKMLIEIVDCILIELKQLSKQTSEEKQMNEEELKKGCGKEIDKSFKYKCGEKFLDIGKEIYYLCPTCQAKLLQRQEDVKDFEKKINDKIKAIQNQARSIPKAYYLEFGECMLVELKQSLKGEEEK